MERVQEVEPEQPATVELAGRLVAAPDPSGLLAWASGVGNHAAAAYLARTAADGSHGSPGVPESDFDPRAASDDERVAELRRRLAEGGSLREVWRSFADVRATANANAELWKASVARDPGLAEDEEVLGAFRQAVEAIAVDHLSENRDEVWREMHDLGVTQDEQSKDDPEHLAKVAELQKLADEVVKALQLKQVLLQIPVGFHEDPSRKYDASDPQGRKGESTPALFRPGNPPVNRSSGGPGFRSYESVVPEYAKVEEVLARGMAHPALFGMVEQAGGPVDKDAHAAVRDFAGTRPELAQARAGEALHTLMRGIETTTRQIGSGVDYRDLRPVHDQVLATATFSGAYERSIAEAAIAGHDTMKTLISFGLAAVQAIALLATPLIGAAALIPIVGAGTVQAGMSYADYQRLKTARAARTGAQGSEVVDEGTVDAAQLQAVLDTVFVFVDGIEGFAAVAKAARLGAKAGAAAAQEVAEELPKLATLAPERRDAVLGQAMATMGPGPAIDGAGGIEVVRSAAAGMPAAARAEGYVAGLEDGLAHHLAGAEQAQAASEPLLPRAQAYVAEQAQVPEARGLKSLLPRRMTEAELAELAARRAKDLAPEWVGKTPEARRDVLRVVIHEQAAELGIPAPWLVGDAKLGKNEGSFLPSRWEIALSEQDFGRDLTIAEMNALRARVRHEVQHALQLVEAGRYAVFHAGDPGFLSKVPGDVRAAIRKRGKLDPASPEYQRAATWHQELGPGGAKSSAVIRQLEQSRLELDLAKADFKQARRHWRDRTDAVLRAAPGSAEEDSAAAETLLAYREYVTQGTVYDTKLAAHRKAYTDYRALPTEVDAWGTEEAFRVELEERWSAEVKAEVDRDMNLLVARRVLVAVGVGGAGYAGYRLAHETR